MHMFVIGDRESAAHFEAMGARAEDMEPALLLIAEQLRGIAATSMESQGRRGGGSWAFLKPETLRRKLRKGLDPRIEFATQALYNSLTSVAPGSRAEIVGDSLHFGSDLAYAGVQNFGGGPSNLPARPLVSIVDGDRKRMAQTILDHIVR